MLRPVFCVLLSLFACDAGTLTAAEKRPNVLFIAVDDLNDWIGCLGGHPQTITPHIDKLARSGVLFRQSHCAAPACNPSRAALMTGIRPSTSGVYYNPNPWRKAMPDVVTLPQQFMKHGYHARGCGKVYHGGFDDDASWHQYLKKAGDPKPSKAVLNDPHSRAGGIIWGKLDVADADMNDYHMVDYALKYLSESHREPFFLACGIYRPHMPWQVPQKYYDMYPLDKIQLPKVLETDLEDVPPAGVKVAKPGGDHANILKTDNWKHAVQAYLASMTFADAMVGRLLAGLESSEHADNTIVILWGDHGWHLGEKHHWRKFSLWEEATRAPLMIKAPGVTPAGGAVCDRPVDFLAIYPTLCRLCNIPVPNHCEGVSLLPLLKEPAADWPHLALTTHGRNNHAVRSERYRYIRYSDGGEELYDHQTDPMEWKNLAEVPAMKTVKQELSAGFPQKNVPEAERKPPRNNSRKRANAGR